MENLAISHDYVLSAFDYQDGNLIRKSGRVNEIGQIAGCVHKGTGYIHVKIKAKAHKAHRLVFLYHHGYLPEFVDHIDGDKSNNRIENLRLATYSQNQHNRKLCSTNTSGVKGVYWDKRKKKWRGRIESMGKKIHVGYWDTLEEAEAAMTIARNKLHGEFARHE
jgi:hypothetical protein